MAVNNSLVKNQSTPSKDFSLFMTGEAVKKRINEVIGGKSGPRFISSIISAVNTNPMIAECDHGSILSAAILGESLKLDPSPQLGQYYLVPFNDTKRGVKVAQFQLGYKGYIQLATRSGMYKKINVTDIKQGELRYFDPLTETIEVELIDDFEAREKTPTIGYYAMFEYTTGFVKAIYWSRQKMENHALQYSQGYKSDKAKGTQYTFWAKNFDAMAFKTMLRQLISKWGVMSVEFQTGYQADSAVIEGEGKYNYVDNQPALVPEPQTTAEEFFSQQNQPDAGQMDLEGTPFA